MGAGVIEKWFSRAELALSVVTPARELRRRVSACSSVEHSVLEGRAYAGTVVVVVCAGHMSWNFCFAARVRVCSARMSAALAVRPMGVFYWP